jgi:hypothetical protein
VISIVIDLMLEDYESLHYNFSGKNRFLGFYFGCMLILLPTAILFSSSDVLNQRLQIIIIQKHYRRFRTGNF